MITEDHLQFHAAKPASDGAQDASLPPDATTVAGDGYYRIEHVAARTGLTKRTLRYYEEIGLLAPPTRTEGGYRLYSEHDIQELQRIKRLKDLLGFSLAEIRKLAQAEEEREELRAAWAHETNPRTRLERLERVEELTQRQLRMVEEKLAGLEEMRGTVQARLSAYEKRRVELLAEMTQDTGSAE